MSIIASLTPAPGRQDHTISPYANAPYVGAFAPEADASTAARPNVSDVGQRPLFSGQDGAIMLGIDSKIQKFIYINQNNIA